ncbi:Cystathionine beta-synthase (CBS) family protein [Euphorbia peplus]|nr:Cystathionine beta-synthase (CBS) family protein [Euphorbia peplus]
MASVFLYHVVGDLTVGKPEMVEFCETETVESAIRAIGESTECGIPVWKRRSLKAQCLEDQEKAMKAPVSEVVVPDNSLLKQVDPATRLIDALEMMKQGVKRLLVAKGKVWKGMSKRFSILYNGKWLKNPDGSNSSNNLTVNTNRPSSSASSISQDTFCCLSREDASLPAIEATEMLPKDPSAVAVIESTSDGRCKIIGEISASRLWKCDYLAAAWALANFSSGQFVMGVEDNLTSRSFPDLLINSTVGDNGNNPVNSGGSARPKIFSSRSIGFNPGSSSSFGTGRSMYRGRSAPLTCKVTSSLAAVMAQMLSHRATHVWVTEDDNDDILVGVVGYADILYAVTRHPTSIIPFGRSSEALATEIQT